VHETEPPGLEADLENVWRFGTRTTAVIDALTERVARSWRWFRFGDADADTDHMLDVAYRSRMSSSDAIIWDIEADPRLRSTVLSVWELDSVPTDERLAVNTERMIAAIPRLRQRVEEERPRPRWVDVDVDPDDHVVRVELPAGSTFDDALAEAERWGREPFDRSRPLWRLGIVSGLADGRAVAIIKVHHAIADGLGMVLMLGAFTDIERDPPPRPHTVGEPADARPTWTRLERVRYRSRRMATEFVRGPFTMLARAVRTLASTIRLVIPNRRPCSTLMTGRSAEIHLDTRTLALDDVKQAGRADGGSVNDVFVTVAVDAVRRYHDVHGHTCDRLRIHMPVNARTARTADLAGNQFVPARLVMRFDDDRTTLDPVRAQLERLREEPALHHISPVSAAVQRLGRPISRWLLGGMMLGVDLLASNVPGPPFPLYLAGAKIDRFVGLGPPAGAALNITAFSYDGALHLGITIDAEAITDRTAFLECLDAAIDDVVGTSQPVAAV
jgi:diacylglycerol O-acyltransferase